MKTISLLFLAGLLLYRDLPAEPPTRQEQVLAKATDFFNTYADRNDWDKFCSYYREDVVFDDIILQLHLDSLWQLKRFYNWNDAGNFTKLTPDQKHLSVETLVANDSVAVARGRVNPFYYYDALIDNEWGMEFTFWIYFDEDLKIIKQVDWLEYDDYTLENMIKRCRENGFEAIPEWLDLSKPE
ncbi:MAG: hypothetical protein Tsb0034_19150 [Ekhidna sp.]